MKWSVAGTAVKLYSDPSCKNEVGTKATDARTVYVKGVTKGGKATVTVKSNTDDNKRASAVFTVVPHAFEYTASSNTITATCTLDDCPLKRGDTRYSERLSIIAPSKPVYTGAAFPATLAMSHSYSEFAEFTSLPAIKYQKKDGETWGAATQTVPVEPGTYRASVTLKPASGSAITGSVEYEIAKARLLEWSVKQVGVLTYTGKPQTPKVTTAVKSVNKQPVTFTYSRTYDGPYSEAVPSVTNVSECGGFFCFKVSAPFHEDAIGLFRINMQKAKAPAVVVPTLKSMTYDPHTTLADIPLTGGWMGDGKHRAHRGPNRLSRGAGGRRRQLRLHRREGRRQPQRQRSRVRRGEDRQHQRPSPPEHQRLDLRRRSRRACAEE